MNYQVYCEASCDKIMSRKKKKQMSKFGDWLLRELEMREMSQADLARATGFSPQTISYFLGPKSKRPDDDSLKEIARVFKIPIDQVYRAAGILPSKSNPDELAEQIIHETHDLNNQDKEEVLAYIRMKKNLRNKNGNR